MTMIIILRRQLEPVQSREAVRKGEGGALTRENSLFKQGNWI